MGCKGIGLCVFVGLVTSAAVAAAQDGSKSAAPDAGAGGSGGGGGKTPATDGGSAPAWLVGPSGTADGGCVTWGPEALRGRDAAPYIGCFSLEETVTPNFTQGPPATPPHAYPHPGCSEALPAACPTTARPIPSATSTMRPTHPYDPDQRQIPPMPTPGGPCWDGQGWSFEDGTVAPWTPEGPAFVHQPVFGNNVAIGRIDPPGYNGAHPLIRPDVNVGGDYWEFSRDVNQKGDFWLGTSDRRANWSVMPGTRILEEHTGYLRSPPFEVEGDHLTFVIGGPRHSSQRVELQILPVSFADELALASQYGIFAG